MQYKYFNQQTNKEEKVIEEPWAWEAVYNDGTSLKQFDDNGYFHRFAEIDQSKLHVFIMHNKEIDKQFVLLFAPQAMKLKHYYRNYILKVGTPEESRHRAYIFGWEKTKKDENGMTDKFIVMIFDNEFIITDDPDRIYIENG